MFDWNEAMAAGILKHGWPPFILILPFKVTISAPIHHLPCLGWLELPLSHAVVAASLLKTHSDFIDTHLYLFET